MAASIEWCRPAVDRRVQTRRPSIGNVGPKVEQAFAMAPISALGVVVMFWLLLSMTNNTRASILLALLYAFATPVFYRTAQLNQNVLLANFALFAFALLWRPSAEEAVA